jgi:hypothetical protein
MMVPEVVAKGLPILGEWMAGIAWVTAHSEVSVSRK